MTDSDDEGLHLPEDTLLILQQFLQNRELEKESLEENWQLSQFWYNEYTKETLSGVVKHFMNHAENKDDFKIALVSCPSLYEHVKRLQPINLKLFEYDERFSRYGTDFQIYDYSKADDLNYLEEYKGVFDLILVDPPFLSEECIEKVSKSTTKMLAKNGKLVLCSGRAVKEWAEKYMDLKICFFQPEHKRNLGNEFASYANFDLDEIIRGLKNMN